MATTTLTMSDDGLTPPQSPPLASPEPFTPLISILMFFWNPTPLVAVLTFLAILATPILLHHFLFRVKDSTHLPNFLLLGPSGAGKTALMSFFAGAPTETRTSQVPLSLEASVPAKLTASSQYRASSDPYMKKPARFYLADTPGHGKLRPDNIASISSTANLKGIIFVVDSSLADIGDAAGYLYDTLLELQKLIEAGAMKKLRVLVACAKSDLFTALPVKRVKMGLEEEMGRIRETRARGVVDVEGEGEEKEKAWLGEGMEKLTLEGLDEGGIEVVVKGGSVVRGDWKEELGAWVGEAL